MCSVFGFMSPVNATGLDAQDYLHSIDLMMENCQERGTDGFGLFAFDGHGGDYKFRDVNVKHDTVVKAVYGYRMQYLKGEELKPNIGIGNCRAEPTTEWVKHKRPNDQQPYTCGDWTIVHNGTIANDAELRTNAVPTAIDSAAIVEALDAASKNDPLLSPQTIFEQVILKLKGSFAILAVNAKRPGEILYACNYRPIWYVEVSGAFFIASSNEYLPTSGQMVKPYTYGSFVRSFVRSADKSYYITSYELRTPSTNKKALVVCSGGLDSTVAATKMVRDGYDVTLAHFKYGSRAEGPEDKAIREIAKYLDVPLVVIPMNIYDKKDSPLLQSDSKIAGGEEGAEFAHEWVPARNLVMLSLATAYCEAKGFETLVLGNNLEEAGAYPDNEPEFIKKFNDMLPFAVGDGKRLQVCMPVGNLMKHEIVALGHQLKAPLHLTWSCYRAGQHHCGTCGPCFMRKTAFQINNLDEVITYEK